MEPALKQRLLGAAVLVALAVVFLPLLVMDPAPDSGASRVPLKVPPAPEAATGDTRTLDLPLAPEPTGKPVLAAPVEAAITAPTSAADTAPAIPTTPATAAGNYAVNFGSYATSADAARVIAALAAAKLPAYQEPAPLGLRTVHRVRIGPFATSADAESARLAAGRVRSDVNAKVVVLDADTGAAAKPATTTAAPPAPAIAVAPLPATPSSAATKPAASPEGTAVTAGTQRPAPAASSPPKPATPPAPPAATTASAAPAASSVGFAVQLGAFADANEATRLRDRARAAGFSAFVEQVHTDRGNLSRVRVGPVPDRAAADALRTQVAAKLGVSGIVRPHP